MDWLARCHCGTFGCDSTRSPTCVTNATLNASFWLAIHCVCAPIVGASAGSAV